MKNYNIIFLLTIILLLSSCSGSEVYRDHWKATDMDGNKFEIDFEPKNFKIKAANGKIVEHKYTQNQVKIENSVKTYGIHLGDGRTFNIHFPFADDADKGVIMLDTNEPLYTISRTQYLTYKELYSLTE